MSPAMCRSASAPSPGVSPTRTTRWWTGSWTCAERGRRSRPLDEDVERQQRRDQEVGHVDDLAHAEVDRAAAQRVSLLRVEPARAQVLDHVEQRVARGQRGVLALVDT